MRHLLLLSALPATTQHQQSNRLEHDGGHLHRPGSIAVGTESVMEHLNWGYLQLGLIALAFGGLQVWWISSVFRRRDLARPLSASEFRKTLEGIWSQGNRKV